MLLLVDLDDRVSGPVDADADADDPRLVEQPLGVALLDRDRLSEPGGEPAGGPWPDDDAANAAPTSAASPRTT